MTRARVLQRIEIEWRAFLNAASGLSDAKMLTPGVAGDWSVRDLLAHVAVWEREALRALPIILEDRRAPRYGGVDKFNAMRAAHFAELTPPQARADLVSTHDRLRHYLETLPEPQFASGTRVYSRLRWDTWHHYEEHAADINRWRRE